MSISRIPAIFVRQLFLFKSNPTRLVSIFLWLVIDMIQWGFISKYLGSLGQATFSFITVILGAIILWEFMSENRAGDHDGLSGGHLDPELHQFLRLPPEDSRVPVRPRVTSVVSGAAGFLVMVAIAGALFGYSVLKIGLLSCLSC